MPRTLASDPQPSSTPASASGDPLWRTEVPAWRSFCIDLIFAAAHSPLAYARTFIDRTKWKHDRAVREWFAAKPDEQAVNDLMASWKDWGGGTRKLGHALLLGEELHRWLVQTYPGQTGLRRAQLATGEGGAHSDREGRRRLEETVIANLTLFPPKPGQLTPEPSPIRAEMDRRASRTPEARQRDADALWAGPDSDPAGRADLV